MRSDRAGDIGQMDKIRHVCLEVERYWHVFLLGKDVVVGLVAEGIRKRSRIAAAAPFFGSCTAACNEGPMGNPGMQLVHELWKRVCRSEGRSPFLKW
jgi:hypothetical protein